MTVVHWNSKDEKKDDFKAYVEPQSDSNRSGPVHLIIDQIGPMDEEGGVYTKVPNPNPSRSTKKGRTQVGNMDLVSGPREATISED